MEADIVVAEACVYKTADYVLARMLHHKVETALPIYYSVYLGADGYGLCGVVEYLLAVLLHIINGNAV